MLIVGAGCAGLSLAWQLVERGLGGRRLTLIDPRTSYERDRTWCFFNVVAHPFEHLVSREWTAWRVRERADRWIVREAEGLRYQHLPSDAFYRHVLARLRSTPGVEVRLGVSAGDLHERGREVHVETSDGLQRARTVFDSRPPRWDGRTVAGREVSFLQHFEGWCVETEDDRFEPGVATLMDFAVPQAHGVHFFYVLPFGRRRALVEATWFGAKLPEDRDRVYRDALTRHLGDARYAIRWRERGIIPMSSEAMPNRPGERVYRVGLLGGMAKPSTGYAFQAIQSFSREMARRMDGAELPEPPPPRPWRSRFQDRVFLSYLARHTPAAPATLVQLFEKVPPTLLARFLADRTAASESVEVMKHMPALPMTAEVLRSPKIWLRR